MCNFNKIALTSAVASLFLVACGGGDGGSSVITPAKTLSGTVAGGAAVVGNVIVTDSKGATLSAAIGTNGQYSIDVSSMTGPFVLKASGTIGNTTVTYFSAATTADVGGTVNVTPFTDLMVSNIAAQLAVNYFNDPANIATIGTLITPAKLAAAETAMQAKLQPVLTAMGLGTSVDLLHQAFTADHSGLDAVLDLVKVSTNASTNVATLTNALTQVVIGTDNAAAATLDATPVNNADLTGINPTTATDLQTVVAKLNAFSALFTNGLPSLATLQNSGVFDTSSNFMMGGQTFTQFATSMTTEQKAIGLKFSNVDIALDPSGTTGTLTATISSNDSSFGDLIQLKMVKDATKGWLIEGDGRIANFSISAQAQLNQWTTLASAMQQAGSGSSMSNGIWINIDPFDYNSNHTSAMAVSAVVTGPGLPGGGINMVQDTQNTWFDVAAYGNNNLIPECGTPMNTSTGTVTAGAQCVTVAQAVDNSIYTVVLKDGSGNSLNGAGYQLRLPKQPVSYSALTQAMFPAFTGITIGGQTITPSAVQANANVAISWTMPSGIGAKDLSVWANITTGQSYFNVQQSLLSTAMQTLVSLGTPLLSSGTVTNAGVWLEGVDTYGRRFATTKSVQSQ
jgi:hypothetical protein